MLDYNLIYLLIAKVKYFLYIHILSISTYSNNLLMAKLDNCAVRSFITTHLKNHMTSCARCIDNACKHIVDLQIHHKVKVIA